MFFLPVFSIDTISYQVFLQDAIVHAWNSLPVVVLVFSSFLLECRELSLVKDSTKMEDAQKVQHRSHPSDGVGGQGDDVCG